MLNQRLKKIICVVITLAFLASSLSPAWAREGNFGKKNSFEMAVLGGLAGSMASAGWQGMVTTGCGDLAGLYMYNNYYHDYGKPLITYKFGGEEITISRGAFVSMVASVVASTVSGLITDSIEAGIKEAAKTTVETAAKETAKTFWESLLDAVVKAVSYFVKDLIAGTVRLFTSETIKQYLEKKGVDEAVAIVAGQAAAYYSTQYVDVQVSSAIAGVHNLFIKDKGNKWIATNKGKWITQSQLKAIMNNSAQNKTENGAAKTSGGKSQEGIPNEGAKGGAIIYVAVSKSEPKSEPKPVVNKDGIVVRASGERVYTEWHWYNGLPLETGDLGDFRYMVYALAKIVVLEALNYNTYKGSNEDKLFDNAVKSVIADAAGSFAAAGWSYFNNDNKASRAYQRQAGKEEEGFGTYMLREGLAETGSALGSIAWDYYCKINDIDQNAATELIRLAITDGLYGLANKGRVNYYYDNYNGDPSEKTGIHGNFVDDLSHAAWNARLEPWTPYRTGNTHDYSQFGNPTNFEMHVSAMARGANTIQATTGRLYSNMLSTESQLTREAISAAITPKQTEQSVPATQTAGPVIVVPTLPDDIDASRPGSTQIVGNKAYRVIENGTKVYLIPEERYGEFDVHIDLNKGKTGEVFIEEKTIR